MYANHRPILGVVLLTSLLGLPPLADAAISKQQLLELIRSGVEEAVVLDLVRRDCVDFEVTPEVVLELSPDVPAEVLRAAIACGGGEPVESEESEPPAAVEAADSGPPPGLSTEPAYALKQVSHLAVIPATLDEVADDALTAALIDEIKKQRPRYRLIDPVELAVRFEDKNAFNSGAPLRSLLTAARAQGAQAVLLASASTYRRLEDPGVRIELKLVETNQGTVLWSGGGQGVSNFFNWQTAKRNAARKSVAQMP